MNAPERDVSNPPAMSPEDFALLGGGHVGYVREITAAKASELMSGLPDLPPKTRLFALYAADGTCMSITDSHDAALANAFEHDLQPVPVH
jgi:hypothetical protein